MTLPPGWDGYKGRPLSRANAEIAMQLLATVCSAEAVQPHLVPLASGGLQIEWHHGDVDLEVTLFKPNRISVFRCCGNEEGDEWTVTSDFSSIRDVVPKT
jgi:hypothetical protein